MEKKVNSWCLSVKDFAYDCNPSATTELNDQEGVAVVFQTGEKRVSVVIINLRSFDTNEDIPAVEAPSDTPQGYYLAAKQLTDSLGLSVITLSSIIDLLVHKKTPEVR